MTVTEFSLHHLMAFMIALASLGNLAGQPNLLIEESHEGAKPMILRATRTPAGYAITTVENRTEAEEKGDARGVVASRKVEATITETTTVMPTEHNTRFNVSSPEKAEELIDLATVFGNVAQIPVGKDGKAVLRRGNVDVEVERNGEAVTVRQRGRKVSFTVRPDRAER